MSQETKQEEAVKQPKTYEQAFSELKSFIIQSRKEEAAKKAAEEEQNK